MTIHRNENQSRVSADQRAGGADDADRRALDLSSDELRADIAQARAELGQTLQELAGRADIPARARESASQAVQRMRAIWLTPTPWLVLTTGFAATALLVLLVRRRDNVARRPRRHLADARGGGAARFQNRAHRAPARWRWS